MLAVDDHQIRNSDLTSKKQLLLVIFALERVMH